MKNTTHPQSATSLPRAPRDDAGARSKRYLIMMGIRVLCFILMVLITPYGWYTWILGAAAIFLPYIAVVLANAGDDVHETDAENPERQLTAGTAPVIEPDSESHPTVIRLQESPPRPTGTDERE